MAQFQIHNFNISVGATHEFMQAVKEQKHYSVKDPITGESVEEQNAEEALNLQLERSDIIFNINTLKKRFSTYINNQSR